MASRQIATDDRRGRPARIHGCFVSRGTNGTKENVLVVEIKCVGDDNSIVTEIYASVGQYQMYRLMLERSGLSYPLYLAVPRRIFEQKFDKMVFELLSSVQVMLVVVDIELEEIVRWIDYRTS